MPITVDASHVITKIADGFVQVERQSVADTQAVIDALPPEFRQAAETYRRRVVDSVVAQAFALVTQALAAARADTAPAPAPPAVQIPDPPPGAAIN